MGSPWNCRLHMETYQIMQCATIWLMGSNRFGSQVKHKISFGSPFLLNSWHKLNIQIFTQSNFKTCVIFLLCMPRRFAGCDVSFSWLNLIVFYRGAQIRLNHVVIGLDRGRCELVMLPHDTQGPAWFAWVSVCYISSWVVLLHYMKSSSNLSMLSRATWCREFMAGPYRYLVPMYRGNILPSERLTNRIWWWWIDPGKPPSDECQSRAPKKHWHRAASPSHGICLH